MKGVVLAGGTGSRLRPLTHTWQKQVLPAGPTPIIVRAVRRLSQAGIDEVGVVLGDTGRQQVRNALGDGSDHGVCLSYVEQGAPAGIADAIGCCDSFVGDDPFVVHFGDTVFGASLRPLVEAFEPGRMAALLGVTTVDEPTAHSIVVRDGRNRVRAVFEKPADPPTDLSPVVDVFSPAIFDEIRGLEPSERGELEIIDAVRGLLDSGRVVGTHDLDGRWADAGTPDGYLRANDIALRTGRVPTARSGTPAVNSARRTESDAVEPAVAIGEGARITGDAEIGPGTVVGEGARIDGASVSGSVVLPRATLIGDFHLSGSIVGRRARVRGTNGGRHRLIVGDDSRIEL